MPVVVKNHRELVKSFRDMDKAEARLERAELRGVGQLVRVDAAALLAPVSARSAAAFKVRVRQKGVAVEQSLRRTTGQHPEFGTLQMREALLPALNRREPEVVAALEAMLDRIAAKEGF